MAALGRLDHEWWIVIELDGSVWCDDDHVFGKSIFWGFWVKLLIFFAVLWHGSIVCCDVLSGGLMIA